MKDTTTEKPPNPGSDVAIELGCICPRMDNNYGRGYMGMEGVFVYREGCPVHDLPELKETE